MRKLFMQRRQGLFLVVISSFLAILCLSCRSPILIRCCFPTDDGLLMYFDDQRKEFVPDPAKIQEMRNRPECRPAEKDPEGHWGLPQNGFQMSVRLPRNSFVAGDAIPAEMFVRNVSGRELSYAVLVPDKNLKIELRRGEEFVLSKGQSSRADSFAGRLTDVVKDSSPRLLISGTQHQFTFRLSDLYDLTTPGHYTVRVGRLIPGIGVGISQECMSEWAEFEIHAK